MERKQQKMLRHHYQTEKREKKRENVRDVFVDPFTHTVFVWNSTECFGSPFHSFSVFLQMSKTMLTMQFFQL